MKQTATNQFNDGLNFDLHPIVTPNSVLTDNINGTLITYNGNEFCLQNDRGNNKKVSLPEGYIPIGIKEHNGILYIISTNNTDIKILNYPGIDWLHDGELNYDIYSEFPNIYYITNIYYNSNIPDWVWETAYHGPLSNKPIEEEWNGIKNDTTHTLTFTNLNDRNFVFEYLTNNFIIGNINYSNYFSTIKKESILKTEKLNWNTSTPLTIEVQDSYDGSINLIVIDGKNDPIIVNSGFSINSNAYSIIKNPTIDTLFLQTKSFPIISLSSITSSGLLPGGNYTFYIKYSTDEGDVTDFVAESGIVSIWKGTGVSIEGTLMDENSGKTINLSINNLDTKYNKLKIYITREYSDVNGFSLTEAYYIDSPYSFTKDSVNITITGSEKKTSISIEDLNIQYHVAKSARAIAQQQDMLFLGNVDVSSDDLRLKELTYQVEVSLNQKNTSIGWQTYSYKNNTSEYFSATNIYNYLGYWADEFYRFGIVYIKEDGSLTSVYNVLGRKFSTTIKDNSDIINIYNSPTGGISPINSDLVNGVTANTYGNVRGVFCTSPDALAINFDEHTVKPWYFNFYFSTELQTSLKDLGIIGCFVVRQKRIPKTLCQGIVLGIDNSTGIPELIAKNSNKTLYLTQTFNNSNNNKGLLSDVITVSPGSDQAGSLSNRYYLIADGSSGSTHCSYHITFLGNDSSSGTAESANVNISHAPLYKLYRNGNFVETNDPNCYHDGISNKIVPYYTYDGNAGYLLYMVRGSWYYYTLPISNWPVGLSSAYNSPSDIPLLIETQEFGSDYILNTSTSPGATCILSLDPIVVQEVKSILNGTQYQIKRYSNNTEDSDAINNGQLYVHPKNSSSISNIVTTNCTYVDINSSKYIDNQYLTTIIGNAYNISESGFAEFGNNSVVIGDSKTKAIRGNYTPYIYTSYNLKNYIGSLVGICSTESEDNLFRIRYNDNSPFYCVSNRFAFNNTNLSINVYRGDCYTNTVTMRYNWNFLQDKDLQDNIIEKQCWNTAIGSNTSFDNVDWSNVNLDDINNVPLGLWVTFKCYSNYNLQMRSSDYFDTITLSKTNNPKSFYPRTAISSSWIYRQPDTSLHNSGYDITVGSRRNQLIQDIAFINTEYATRIMFSNKNVQSQFINGYRIFQGLSYHDYDKQYGEIVKLIPWGNNLFCVFEHGLAILPVNEKALLQTTTEQTIHIYGHGVLPDTMSIVSQDYGSQYEHSVIRTPLGIYGIDVDAKKIWRFTDKQGFETISDMKIETFLEDSLRPLYNIELPDIDVRTHYNAFKGDVIFTWYDKKSSISDKDKHQKSICFNERQSLWTTQYDWVPIVSENINGDFYTLQKSESENTNVVNIYSHDVENSKPTEWFDKQHKFEFEFVVSDPIGVHKIFDNLQIISNNVQPEEMEITVVGDDYEFKRVKVEEIAEVRTWYKTISESDPNNVKTTSDIHGNLEADQNPDDKHRPDGYYHFDKRLNQSVLTKWQPFKDIYKFGRRIGNIQYRGGMWYTQVEPLLVNSKKEARIRDKWAKIRIRYTGKDLAVITAIKTLINI